MTVTWNVTASDDSCYVKCSFNEKTFFSLCCSNWIPLVENTSQFFGRALFERLTSTTHGLTITNLTTRDAGWYECRYSGGMIEAYLDVLGK